jgi:trigger factor
MKEVHVTFPENYHASDLAGKAVIFEMTVHYIIGDPELTDEFVVDYTEGEMTTAEQFTAAIRADMEEQARQSVLSQALWSKLNEISAVTEYPEDAVMYHYSYSYAYYSQYAAMFGMSYEAFLAYSGVTPEYVFESCKTLVKRDMVRHAIYAAEGLTCSEEDYQKTLDEYTEENYDDLRASMIASGKEDYTKEEAREYFDTNYKSQLKDTYLQSVACERLLAKVTIQEIAS